MPDLTAMVGYLDATTIMTGDLFPPEVRDGGNKITELVTEEVDADSLGVVSGTLPLTFTPSANRVEDYVICGRTGGVGDQSGSGYAIPLTVHGKNLIQQRNRTRTQRGITFTPNADGSVTLNGTANDSARYVLTNDEEWIHPENGDSLPAGTYTAGYSNDAGVSGIGCFYGVYESGGSSRYGKGTFTIAEGDKVALQIQVNSGTVCNNVKVYPQLEAGSTATDYEPYFSSTVTVTTDAQLYPGDRLFMSDTGVVIPAVSGKTNILEAGTAVTPEMTVIYKEV